VGAEDQQASLRHLREVVDEARALGAELLHHVAVVDDLVAHVHRRPVALEHEVDDVDRVGDPGAEAARARHEDRALGSGLGHRS
jgi:hypothetical protein